MKVNFNIFKNLVSTKNYASIKDYGINIDKTSKIYRKIEPELPTLRNVVLEQGYQFNFVPKGDSATLMNFGPYTTVLRNDDLQSKIAEQIYDHIHNVRNL